MKAKVTVFIPATQHHVATRRAIDSALLQEEQIEVVVADGTSSEETRAICEAAASRDARVRYILQSRGLDPFASFLAVRALAAGKYFLWLDANSWLDAGYVRSCADVLDRSSEHVLVAGTARYFDQGEMSAAAEDALIVLEQASRRERVLTYFALVDRNGIFGGLFRLETLRQYSGRPTQGWDWSVVAAHAFLGKVRSVQTVHRNCLHEHAADAEAERLRGLTGYSATQEHRVGQLARELYADIAARNGAYSQLTPCARNRLALEAVHAVTVNRYGSLSGYARSQLALRRRAGHLVRLARATARGA